MVDIAKLVVRMEADNAKLHTQLEQANKQLARFDKGARDALKGFKALAGGLVAGISFAKFASDIKTVVNEADRLGKMAQSVGVTTESLSALQYAADLSGASLEVLGVGLRQLSKNAADAARGTGQGKAGFDALGLSVTDASGQVKDADTLFAELATRFQGMQDGAGKTAIAMKVFGESGAALIPMLNQGADGIAAMSDEARQFGVIIDDDMAQAAARFNDNLTRMGAAADGLKFQVADALLPALESITRAMTEAAKEGSLLEVALVGIGGVMYNLAVPADRNANAIKNLDKEIRRLEVSLGNLSAVARPGDTSSGVNAEVERLKAQIAELTFLRNELANPVQVLNGPAASAATPKTTAPNLPDPKAEAAAKSAAARAQSEALRQQRDYERSLQSLVDKLDPVAAKTREYSEAVDLLNSARARGDLSEIRYVELLDELYDATNGITEAERERRQELEALLRTTVDAVDPNARLVRELEALDDLLGSDIGAGFGDVILERMLQINEEMDGLAQKTEDTSSVMTEFGKQAARNMQDAFADFLFDQFDDGLDGMLKGFGQTLQRMVAEAVAADIFKSLGGLGGPIGGFFGLLNTAATGTNFAPGGPTLVGERGPEIVNLPRGAQVIPAHRSGGRGYNITVNVTGAQNPGEVRRAAAQGAREALAAINGAQRYV